MGKNTFNSLQIIDITRETADTVSIALHIPGEMKDDFYFEPGQYLTFKATINGEEVRRAYSICSAPFENECRIAVKKVENGTFSIFANETLKVGDKLDVMAPMGNFKLNPQQGRNYLAIAAGSGITPIMSMAKASVQSQSNFTLLYGSKSENDIIFKNQLDKLQSQSGGKLKVQHVLSRQEGAENHGRIDAKFLENHLLNNSYDGIYLCGPESLINTASEVLSNKGYAKDRIHFELFTAPLVEVKEVEDYVGGKFKSEVTYIIDDEEKTISVDSHGESVLEAGLMEDLDLPFACKGGVCCTCKCQVKEGQVEMDVNYALDDDEIEEGYVLACQSHPRSEKVVLDFDV